MSGHPRNTGPMCSSPRCGARTRKGTLCKAPAIAGAQRCRMHGGKGSGAPRGNRNAYKHGGYRSSLKDEMLDLWYMAKDARALLIAARARRMRAKDFDLVSLWSPSAELESNLRCDKESSLDSA